MNDATLPSDEQVDELIDLLLPANEEMDRESASIVLERAGIDRQCLANALKSRLQQRVAKMSEQGESIPPSLLKLIDSL